MDLGWPGSQCAPTLLCEFGRSTPLGLRHIIFIAEMRIPCKVIVKYEIMCVKHGTQFRAFKCAIVALLI